LIHERPTRGPIRAKYGSFDRIPRRGSSFSLEILEPNSACHRTATAKLTFFTNVKTFRVTPHGPFTIIIREGTTTFYRSTAPASFASPGPFQSGEPIESSTIRQQ
jgi:hypothetical protein